MKSIVVVGSSNVDLVMQVKKLPLPGETVGDGKFVQVMGGKGANQAVAASRLGGKVSFISAVGADAFGREAKDSLAANGVDVDAVTVKPGTATGTALIFVDQTGENVIGVAPGANGQLSLTDIDQCRLLVIDAALILIQLEIPIATIEHVVELAHQHQVPVVLNAAPFDSGVLSVLPKIDTLIVNQIEAQQINQVLNTSSDAAELSSRSKNKDKQLADVERNASALISLGVKKVVTTLGADGVHFLDSSGGQLMAAQKVTVVDTTGAGDTFCGALVAELSRGAPLGDAVSFAQKAAALAVTKLGAQAAIPKREQIDC